MPLCLSPFPQRRQTHSLHAEFETALRATASGSPPPLPSSAWRMHGDDTIAGEKEDDDHHDEHDEPGGFLVERVPGIDGGPVVSADLTLW